MNRVFALLDVCLAVWELYGSRTYQSYGKLELSTIKSLLFCIFIGGFEASQPSSNCRPRLIGELMSALPEICRRRNANSSTIERSHRPWHQIECLIYMPRLARGQIVENSSLLSERQRCARWAGEIIDHPSLSSSRRLLLLTSSS